MIRTDIADELGLAGPVEELCTAWTDDSVRKDTFSRRVKLMISGVGQTRWFNLHNVRTASHLKLPLPSATNTLMSSYKHLRNINIPQIPISRPGILIGLEHVKLGLMYEIREGKWNEPVASRTRLGWVIHGKETESNTLSYSCYVCDCQRPDELSELMKSFYTTESLGVSFKAEVEAQETSRARQILETTTKQVHQQFETGLIWKRDDIKLPESKSVAMKRLLCFEQKLQRDESLKNTVNAKLREHIDKGYLVKVNAKDYSNTNIRHWYLPIFVVHNPNKPSKPRIVFDAAAKSHGVSLNDTLLKGPEMQVSLIGIMMRFRMGKFAISADIEEMFHRVMICERDQSCQLVLWGECANYVKNVNAKRFIHIYPRAVDSIIDNHYVDDLLESFDDEDEALIVAQQIQLIHSSAGFKIRNWISNSSKISRCMNSENKINEINMNLSDETSTEKILGMFWSTKDDEFVFKVNLSKVNPEVVNKMRLPTKREMLRIIMSQFDPLGILAPVIVYAKIMMQEVWKCGVNWDDMIPSHLENKWFDWLDALQQLTTLKVPRWYFKESCELRKKIILHIFADASEEAFAAVGFIQVIGLHERYSSFVAAKSRVAPQKSLTIPRLELQAAILATRLKNTIVSEMKIQFNDVRFWTDSQTVIGWIRSSSRKYSAFVSHRVSEILDSSTINQWYWLPTKMNVADEATRSIELPSISNRWLNGPTFLDDEKTNWPRETPKISTTHEEVKCVNIHHQPRSEDCFINVQRFSKYERLLRTVAYVLRFTNILLNILKNAPSPQQSQHPPQCQSMTKILPLTSDELQDAEFLLYKIVQSEHYSSEIYELSNHDQRVSKNSNIFNLNPIIDDRGLVRMAGRIEVAPPTVAENLKQPIILHPDHHITTLLIDSIHRKFHHVNKECVVNHIRQFLWIPKIRARVNKVVQWCNFCRNRLAKPSIPRMAPLPESRLCPNQPPFTYTGMDYFGPIEVSIGRRHEKRWGVLFVCLTMRAIHIELAATLATDSAIICVRNFINRRGPPLQIISDNGSNLRAAEKELKKAIQEIDFNRLQEELTHPLPNETRPSWKFIPPSAPHFGGSWERMIRIVKQSLYIILKGKYPKEETLRSALIEIENLVNSRPLYYSANEVDNPESITPNHLLRGTARQVVPLNGSFDCRKQWRVSQALASEFWRRWLHEYLPTISKRPKWQSEVDAIRVGQLVLIVDNTLQRGEWRKGIVTKIYPSKDGRIRTAEEKTTNGIYLRPVAKLAIINIGTAQ